MHSEPNRAPAHIIALNLQSEVGLHLGWREIECQKTSQCSRGVDIVSHKRETKCGNDPSAGSPTETLLRLLLPLNDQV